MAARGDGDAEQLLVLSQRWKNAYSVACKWCIVLFFFLFCFFTRCMHLNFDRKCWLITLTGLITLA